ncbi:hypothetical protein J3Q64DRAFT_1853152 [Phycomyces blakesleeanus]|uniref:Uncharacterized protein n=1 Tax=Phycomyces blakesleeanus TaxID=4837 RepID=A0ABR3AIZ8_PHYBL
MPIQESPSVLHILFLCFKICLRSWEHLTYTTSGGSAQHRDEGRLSVKKRSWRNALKPSASYSESWTPPELSQGPADDDVTCIGVGKIISRAYASVYLYFPSFRPAYVYASGPAGEFIRVRKYFGELLNRSGGVQDSEYEAEGFKALRQLLFLTLSRPSSRCCADPPDVQILKHKNKMWSTDGLSWIGI